MLRRSLRRLLPPVQTSHCDGCAGVIRERRRRPCRACGSINRHVSVTATDAVALADLAG